MRLQINCIMLQAIAEDRALKTLDTYFSVVEKTGYVKENVLDRFMMYLFLIDFVEFTHDFFTEKDYDIVADALASLFSTGNCMLPYPVFCTNRFTLGRAHYMGTFKVRVTEAEEIIDTQKRITEDDIFRTV